MTELLLLSAGFLAGLLTLGAGLAVFTVWGIVRAYASGEWEVPCEDVPDE